MTERSIHWQTGQKTRQRAKRRCFVNNKPTAKEREHLARIKEMPCSVCGAEGPSDAHHIEQHKQYLCIPLCKDCHQGGFNGIHGQGRIWSVLKKDEMSCLNETYRRLIDG